MAESDLIKRAGAKGKPGEFQHFREKKEKPEKESEQEQTVRKGSQRTRNLPLESETQQDSLPA